MERRNFIMAGLATAPLLRKNINIGGSKTIPKGFVLKQGEDRYQEHIKIGGVNPVDIKVSAADTVGALSMSEYTGFTTGGPPLHIHPFQQMKIVGPPLTLR